MPHYLLTDSAGVPLMNYGRPDQDAETFVARVGSTVATRVWKGSRANFYVGADPVDAAAALGSKWIWPLRLFRVEPDFAPYSEASRTRWATAAEVLEEVSVFRVFGHHAGEIERFCQACGSVTAEQWIRIACLADSRELAEVARYGPGAEGGTARSVLTSASLTSDRLSRQLGLAVRFTSQLAMQGLAKAWMAERGQPLLVLQTATRVLMLGDKVAPGVRDAALAPFKAVIGPAWEVPKRTEPPSPAVSLAPSAPITHPARGEELCPSIS
ncbi:MAG: hypothetical protein M0000_05665 [Actinomycetota bacterium]|nr:hypothetical protein [Actinomycetota bacterium]